MAAVPSLTDPAGSVEGDAQAAPLETYANNSTPPAGGGSVRRERYRRRGLLWEASSLERVRKCGRVPVMPGGSVAVRLHKGVAGFAGLASCGSVWADPVCNAKIMARRAVEIGAAIARWQHGEGGATALVTLTMRHHRHHRLETVWDALTAAWGSVTNGKQWAKDKQRHQVAGWVRVVEVTLGVNGWHVHVHAVLFLEGKQTDETVAQLHARMFGRWSRALVRGGLPAPLMVGQDAHLVHGPADTDLARYFTKAVDAGRAVGVEVTHSQGKRARGVHGTRTPWGLLDDVESLGLAESLALWHEWEQASKGRRQVTWSQGIRKRLGLLAEVSDEDIAAEEHGSSDDDLVLIDGEGWRHLTRCPEDLADLLTITQQAGLAGLRFFLDSRGITYEVLDRAGTTAVNS